MTDFTSLAAVAFMALASIAVLCATLLRAWRDWIALKRLELGGRQGRPVRLAGARIELADLRERVRRLEAIANGTEM